MPLNTTLSARREEIIDAAADNGVRNIRILPPHATAPALPTTDEVAETTDEVANGYGLLVDLDPGRTLKDVGKLFLDLQCLLGLRLGIITEQALHWRTRAHLVRAAVPL